MERCEERDAANAVTRRLYAEGERVGATSLYYTRDHLGSIRELLDSTATVRARYDYAPYGERTKLAGDLDTDVGFTGHQTHATTSLTLAPFRAYDAVLGRWISPDPIGETGGINLYGYVGNSPACYVDPTGEWAHIAIAAGIGGLINGGISSFNGGSFWKGFVAGAVGAGVAAATFNPAAGLAAGAGMGGVQAAMAGGAASGALGTCANTAVSAMVGQCPTNIGQSLLTSAITGAILGPLGAAANEFQIGTRLGNLGQVGSLTMSITETSLSTIPSN